MIVMCDAGSLVLLEGIDPTITKTATVVPEFLDEAVYIFKPLQFQTQAVMKIACEPLNPSELPKMVRSPIVISFSASTWTRSFKYRLILLNS